MYLLQKEEVYKLQGVQETRRMNKEDMYDMIELTRGYLGAFIIPWIGLHAGWFGSLRW